MGSELPKQLQESQPGRSQIWNKSPVRRSGDVGPPSNHTPRRPHAPRATAAAGIDSRAQRKPRNRRGRARERRAASRSTGRSLITCHFLQMLAYPWTLGLRSTVSTPPINRRPRLLITHAVRGYTIRGAAPARTAREAVGCLHPGRWRQAYQPVAHGHGQYEPIVIYLSSIIPILIAQAQTTHLHRQHSIHADRGPVCLAAVHQILESRTNCHTGHDVSRQHSIASLQENSRPVAEESKWLVLGLLARLLPAPSF